MGLSSCLLLFLLLTVSTRHVSAACGDPPIDPCGEVSHINCAGCMFADARVPDPSDCHKYYLCTYGVLDPPLPLSCPDGMIFNLTTLSCEPGSSCEPLCDAGGVYCVYTCNANPDNFIDLADPYDCSIYYHCFWGYPNLRRCPATAPYFDGYLCQEDVTHCCHCRPYCYSLDVGMRVADPKDCRKYHLCKREGIPDVHGECDPDQYFDARLHTCSSTVPCITFCKNVVGRDGCIDPFTCVERGYFAKCPYKCVPEYYHCTEISDTYAVPATCPNGSVFHPDNLECIEDYNCPYH